MLGVPWRATPAAGEVLAPALVEEGASGPFAGVPGERRVHHRAPRARQPPVILVRRPNTLARALARRARALARRHRRLDVARDQ